MLRTALRSALGRVGSLTAPLEQSCCSVSFSRSFADDAGAKKAQDYKQELSSLRKSFQEETRKQRAEEEEKKKALEHTRAEYREQRKVAEAARRKDVDAKLAAEQATMREYMVRVVDHFHA